jgi:hypothetical protein
MHRISNSSPNPLGAQKKENQYPITNFNARPEQPNPILIHPKTN